LQAIRLFFALIGKEVTVTNCSNCGCTEFVSHAIVWPELREAWQLSEAEAAYIDDQQGRICRTCEASLRGVALGNAIRRAVGTDHTLREFVLEPRAKALRILDINGAHAISPSLATLPGYVRGDHPSVDLHALPYADDTFDLVIHSDTLEHIERPIRGLEECRRVLTAGGHLCFTVPVIVGRLSRSRAGLPPSYHGRPGDGAHDYLVHTEFGADAWTYLFQAGFTDIAMTQVEYPAATAFTAYKPTTSHAASPNPADSIDAGRDAVSAVYDQDGLRSVHNHEFMDDPEFRKAYARGIAAVGADYRWHWRVHVGLWAAACAAKLAGDFVECGVNRGFLSSAIMDFLDWDRTGKTFYLLDTFSGLDDRHVSAAERNDGILDRNAQALASGFYTTDVEAVRQNFAQWRNVRIIPGTIPATLSTIDARSIAFLHLDLNCSPPEVAAIEALWDRISPGGLILLDDYAYDGYRSQKLGMDVFAAAKNVVIVSLPTGQGLIVKPPR
jgi:SAM-dependent methyltransferase